MALKYGIVAAAIAGLIVAIAMAVDCSTARSVCLKIDSEFHLNWAILTITLWPIIALAGMKIRQWRRKADGE